MKYIFTILLLAMPITAIAQKSVTEFTPAQRDALQAFIDKQPSYQVIPETWFDKDTLKAARNEWGFGKNFKPYYQTGDFNHDGLRDFAVMLVTGKNINDSNFGMHVVVFNGAKAGKFKVAHIEHEEFSTAQFIATSKKHLYVGIMETDSIGCFVPTRRGYIVEPCGN